MKNTSDYSSDESSDYSSDEPSDYSSDESSDYSSDESSDYSSDESSDYSSEKRPKSEGNSDACGLDASITITNISKRKATKLGQALLSETGINISSLLRSIPEGSSAKITIMVQSESLPNKPVPKKPNKSTKSVSKKPNKPKKSVSKKPNKPTKPVSKKPKKPTKPVSKKPNKPKKSVSKKSTKPKPDSSYKEYIKFYLETYEKTASRQALTKYIGATRNKFQKHSLNRAISEGIKRGLFSYVNGPSGKIKLNTKVLTHSNKSTRPGTTELAIFPGIPGLPRELPRD